MMTAEEKNWKAAFCREHWPSECEHILRIAEDAAGQTYLFDLPWDMEQTTEPVAFEGRIDWQHMPEGDPEFIYQFNRHRYWICLGQAMALTGDERYAAAFVKELLSWLSDNPITPERVKTTWRTIEAGIRGEHWVKAMEYFKESAAVTEEVRRAFIQGLVRHGEYLMEHNAHFSDKSNWGVLESHGLFVIGTALGKGGSFEAWYQAYREETDGSGERPEQYVKEALCRLERELQLQVMEDGTHWEQSPMYHNEVLRCVLEVLRAGGAAGRELPEILYEKAGDMAYANLMWIKPDHTQPCTGDSDKTDLRDVMTPAALLLEDPVLKACGYPVLDFESVWDFTREEAARYEALEAKTPETTFMALPDSGSWCLRSGWGRESNYFRFKNGSVGGGHGHFDKLHMELCVCGEDVLIDPGRYTYVDGPLRRGLKAASAHNVPLIDGKEYTACTDSWGIAGAAAPLGNQWRQKRMESGEDFYTFLQGSHLGYLPDGCLVNRRILAIGTGIYVVADTFYGNGVHQMSQRFHLSPRGCGKQTENGFSYQGEKARAWFVPVSEGVTVTGEMAPVSEHYNCLEEGMAFTLRKEVAFPASLVTVIFCQEEGRAERLKAVVPVTGRELGADEGEALRIIQGDRSWILVLNHRETAADAEYIGAEGHFGLGRVMVCEEGGSGSAMTVLQW